MNKTAPTSDDARFQSGAEKYAAYLKTVEGRLRLDLTFANLQEFLPPTGHSLRVLDLGCGTGEMAVRLARVGHHVVALDSSLPMLEYARHSAQEAGISGGIEFKHGDAADLADLSDAKRFDLVLCHNVLEYVDDACGVLRSAAAVLRNESSVISILLRNQAGEVLKAAIKDGNLTAAEHSLIAEWANESLYGGRVRLFTTEILTTMLAAASFTVTALRGVRVVSDYLSAKISRDDEYHQVLELERKLGMRPEFAAIARYTHCFGHRAGPVTKEDV
jgi:S-adenosylmethionine-dependent methyltransferase